MYVNNMNTHTNVNRVGGVVAHGRRTAALGALKAMEGVCLDLVTGGGRPERDSENSVHHLISIARQVCFLSSCHRRQEGRERSDFLEQNGTRELCLVVCACVWVRYNETGMWGEC